MQLALTILRRQGQGHAIGLVDLYRAISSGGDIDIHLQPGKSADLATRRGLPLGRVFEPGGGHIVHDAESERSCDGPACCVDGGRRVRGHRPRDRGEIAGAGHARLVRHGEHAGQFPRIADAREKDHQTHMIAGRECAAHRRGVALAEEPLRISGKSAAARHDGGGGLRGAAWPAELPQPARNGDYRRGQAEEPGHSIQFEHPAFVVATALRVHGPVVAIQNQETL